MDGSDYAQQTVLNNAIDDERIGEKDDELMRIVCYDQPIYDDECLEADEWLGLTLGVDMSMSSVDTLVKPMYDQASIVIQDQDSELCYQYTVFVIYFFLIISSGCGWSGADILQCLRECGSSGAVCYCNIT